MSLTASTIRPRPDSDSRPVADTPGISLLPLPRTAMNRHPASGGGRGRPAANSGIAGYLLSTLGAPLFSGNRDLREFGLVAAIGAAVCVTAWQLAFASTWCAFAALVSLMLVRWLWHERAEAEARPPGPDRQQSVEPLVRR